MTMTIIKKTKKTSTNNNTTMTRLLLAAFLLGINAILSTEAAVSAATTTTTREEKDYVDNNSNNNDSSISNFVSPLMISSSSSSSSSSASASSSSSLASSSYDSGVVADPDAFDAPPPNITTSTSTMLRGGSLKFPPIPPFHPHHTGTVHYSSIQNADNGSITYRREINAPCDYGMLVFTVGYASKELPYEYDLYDEAYLWSSNGGLCILYPSYDGYQTSASPFWTLGIDPDTVTFTNLIINPSSMHKVSSRDIINNGSAGGENEN